MADYTVIRSRRRTIALEITRQGTALVRAPLHAADQCLCRGNVGGKGNVVHIAHPQQVVVIGFMGFGGRLKSS